MSRKRDNDKESLAFSNNSSLLSGDIFTFKIRFHEYFDIKVPFSINSCITKDNEYFSTILCISVSRAP